MGDELPLGALRSTGRRPNHRRGRRCVARTSCCVPLTQLLTRMRSLPSRTRRRATWRSGPICHVARTSIQTRCAYCSIGPRSRTIRSSSRWWGWPMSGRPGLASYLRITPEFGVIEIGHIWFGTPLQRTTAATEAIYLLSRHAFDDLGYRRLEWKCNALNVASRRAAERFGPRFEGVFLNHMVVKGRNGTPPGTRSPTRSGPPSGSATRRGSVPRTSDATPARSGR